MKKRRYIKPAIKVLEVQVEEVMMVNPSKVTVDTDKGDHLGNGGNGDDIEPDVKLDYNLWDDQW